MSETVIQVTSLGKRIKGKTILEDISFEINKGDCVALIGPNGAGKTVLMSCIPVSYTHLDVYKRQLLHLLL